MLLCYVECNCTEYLSDKCLYAEDRYPGYHFNMICVIMQLGTMMLSVILLCAVMLSVIMLREVVLGVIVLSVAKLIVMTPFSYQTKLSLSL